MKLIYEPETPEVIQELNEGTGEKIYKIKGVFSTIGTKNRNGRIYPKPLWEKEVNSYQNTLKNGSLNTLMEYQHPPRTNVDPMQAVAKITKLYIKDNYVMGEAVLLNNDKANQLKTLIDNGIKLAVSSRGVGKVQNGIVEDFRLITYDIVTDPSDYNAEMFGIKEGILESKDFFINESGEIEEVENQKDNKEMSQIKEELKVEIKEELKVFKDEITEILKSFKDLKSEDKENLKEDKENLKEDSKIQEEVQTKILEKFSEMFNSLSKTN